MLSFDSYIHIGLLVFILDISIIPFRFVITECFTVQLSIKILNEHVTCITLCHDSNKSTHPRDILKSTIVYGNKQ